jgi:hypothetical protein
MIDDTSTVKDADNLYDSLPEAWVHYHILVYSQTSSWVYNFLPENCVLTYLVLILQIQIMMTGVIVLQRAMAMVPCHEFLFLFD